ncbi:MAG: hypothetical protein RR909_04175 [Bacilli bacterium]
MLVTLGGEVQMNLVSILDVLQSVSVLTISVLFLLGVITRLVIIIAFMKVYKIKFQEAVNASVRITTFGKGK